MLAGNFYKTGDRVQLGGITGDVIDIGILRTTIMECGVWVKADQYNGRVVRVANSFVFKEPVYNYSGDFNFLWDEISIPVKYGSDYKLARDLFKRIADEITAEYTKGAKESWEEMKKKYLIEDAAIEPMVFLVANDNWMEFTIRYVVDFKKRRVTKNLLYNRILDEIEKTEGRIAIASMTVHIVETPTFEVKIARDSK
ncbi:mechanosensitive ion channel domain-containing protein [Thermodesulfovibrio aggregans]